MGREGFVVARDLSVRGMVKGEGDGEGDGDGEAKCASYPMGTSMSRWSNSPNLDARW